MRRDGAIVTQHPGFSDVLGVMEFREHERQPWPERASHPYRAQAPTRHEGIGNALRAAYFSQASDIPLDMAELLAKLD